MLKKVIAIVLVAIMATTCFSVFASAEEYTPEFISKVNKLDDNKLSEFIYIDDKGNEVALNNEFKNDDFFAFNDDATNFVTSEQVNLPEHYDARDAGVVTSVKNQNPFGSCWSFAFCAAAESSLISQGYADNTIDLSESHLVWFTTFNNTDDAEYDFETDYYNGISDPYKYGGNCYLGMSTVARGSGFVLEENYPYINDYDTSLMQYDDAHLLESDYTLKSARFLDETSKEEVKTSILKYGAVATVMNSSYDYVTVSPKGETFYQNQNKAPDHAVTVVGWDDNFPASYFKYTPSSNGAWLIKNSWGEEYNTNGYLWVSYEDTSVNQFCEVVACPTNYDNIYQYDGITSVSALSINQKSYKAFAANIFTAEKDELITSCGFYLFDNADYTCTIKLYKNCSATKPTNGVLLETKTIDASRAGFYNVDFQNKHEIKAGETFSIVIRYYNNAGYYSYAYIPIERNGLLDLYQYGIEPGQSFYSTTGTTWSDCSTVSSAGNIPIKAYVEEPLIPDYIQISNLPKQCYMLNEEIDLTNLEATLFYTNGKSTVINNKDLSVNGFDSSVSGHETISVSYDGLSTSFDIDVFSLENIINLDETSAIIDEENNTIYGLQPGLKHLDDYLTCNSGFSYEVETIGTGSEIKLFYNDTYLTSLYIILFGDVNNDGWYDGMDSVLVNCYVSGMITADNWSEYQIKAADCNQDNIINEDDVKILEQAGLLLTSVNQLNPDFESASYSSYATLVCQGIKEEIEKEEEDSVITEPEDESNKDSETDSENNESENTDLTFFYKTIKKIVKLFNKIFAFIK